MSNDGNNDNNQNISQPDNTKSIIAKVLGIENSAAWEIVSSEPEHNLYMVHHKPEANLREYGEVRGVVVDTKAETIVSRSYGYTPTIVTNQLTVQEGSGNLHLVDELGSEHVLDPARLRLKTGFEGTVINIFKHDGIVYRATRKRLDSTRSRWGASRTFMDMYWALGGPSDEVLFDPNSKYSPYSHSFIIVHPEVLIVSKDNVGDGYLVYLGPKQMWSPDYDECPYKQTQKDGSLFPNITQEMFSADPRVDAGWIDDTVHVPETVTNMNDNVSRTQGHAIFSPHNLSFAEANKHLLFGFYNPFEGYDKLDQRMLPGEFVIIHQLDETGATQKMLRVQSVSYNWRMAMRDNNPNLKHRFFQLVNGSYIKYDTAEGKKRYDSLYPNFTAYDQQSIKNQINTDGPYVVWPQSDPEALGNKESLMYNIWLAFLNSVPLANQKSVVNYIDYLYNKRGELITWLRGLEGRGHLDPTVFSRRVIDIVETTRKFAQERVKNGNDVVRGKKLSVKDITKENIRNFIMKEEGGSLYRLIKEMDNYKKEEQDNKLNGSE